MYIKNIRKKSGEKFTLQELNQICNLIVKKQFDVGFETEAYVKNTQCIKIGLHMKSFQIIPEKLGYNAQIGKYVSSKKGYKRTRIPIWEQREQFNHIVNDVLDQFGVIASAKSGPYVIRKPLGRINEWLPLLWDGSPDYNGPDISYNGMFEIISEIMTEKEAIERLTNNNQKSILKLVVG